MSYSVECAKVPHSNSLDASKQIAPGTFYSARVIAATKPRKPSRIVRGPQLVRLLPSRLCSRAVTDGGAFDEDLPRGRHRRRATIDSQFTGLGATPPPPPSRPIQTSPSPMRFASMSGARARTQEAQETPPTEPHHLHPRAPFNGFCVAIWTLRWHANAFPPACSLLNPTTVSLPTRRRPRWGHPPGGR